MRPPGSRRIGIECSCLLNQILSERNITQPKIAALPRGDSPTSEPLHQVGVPCGPRRPEAAPRELPSFQHVKLALRGLGECHVARARATLHARGASAATEIEAALSDATELIESTNHRLFSLPTSQRPYTRSVKRPDQLGIRLDFQNRAALRALFRQYSGEDPDKSQRPHPKTGTLKSSEASR